MFEVSRAEGNLYNFFCGLRSFLHCGFVTNNFSQLSWTSRFMPESCLVPGCKSNYRSSLKTEGYVQCFQLPKDSLRRELWLRAIPRSNWTPTYHCNICIKHFCAEDLCYIEKYKNKDGEWCEFRRQKPILSENAVPKIFPELPLVRGKSQKEKREVRGNRKKKTQQVEEARLVKENEGRDFDSVSRNLPSKTDCSKLSLFKSDFCCIIYCLYISIIS